MNKKSKQFFVLSVVALAFVIYFGISFASQSTSNNVSSYGWSSYDNAGMGWLSFNSKNCDTDGNNFIDTGDCAGDNTTTTAYNYGVNIDSQGNMIGHAWSPNYGWIKFGGLPGIPSGNATTTADARLLNGKVTGWARACAVFKDGCSGDYYNTGSVNNDITTNKYLGGWDGWISLSGKTSDNSTYGVSVDSATGNFSGYAWGDPKVIGWIDFSRIKMGSITQSKLRFNASSYETSEKDNFEVDLVWSAANPSINFTACEAKSVVTNGSVITSEPTWDGSVDSPDPQANKRIKVPGGSVPVEYQLSCCEGASNCRKFNKTAEVFATSLRIHRKESVAFSPLPATPKQNGLQAAAESSGDYTTTVNWKTEGITTGSCVASGPGVWSNWDGVVANNGSQQIIVRAVSPAVDTFTITCRGQYTDSMISDSFTINTTTPPNPGETGVKLPSYIEN